jgi:hypothetical protein
VNRTPKLLIAAAAFVVATTGCSAAIPPDKKGLEYDGGPMSGTKFSNCANSGTREYRGPGDSIIELPTGQRTYEFSDNKTSADTGPISVVSKDNLTMAVSGVATFSLNSDCKTLQKFWEAVGIKYKADTDDGWEKLLATYLRQPLDRIMDQESKKYAWLELYSNPDVKRAWETAVGTAIVGQVNTLAGGQYFCAPTYSGKGDCGAFSLTLQQPVPPKNVQDSLAAAQQAIQDNNTQKNQNVKVRTELDTIRELVKVLGPQGYILYKAIQDGRITIVPVPQGGNINISPK